MRHGHYGHGSNYGLDGMYKASQRSADDVDLGASPTILDLRGVEFRGTLPAPGAPEPLSGYFKTGASRAMKRYGKPKSALSGGDCGCGCKGAGTCGGGSGHSHGVGDVSEGARIAYGAGALIALLFGTRAQGVIKYASFGAAAYMAYLSYEG